MFVTRRDAAAASVGVLLLSGWAALTEEDPEAVADPIKTILCAETGEQRGLAFTLGPRFFRAE